MKQKHQNVRVDASVRSKKVVAGLAWVASGEQAEVFAWWWSMACFRDFVEGCNFHVLAVVQLVPFLVACGWVVWFVWKHYQKPNQPVFYLDAGTLLLQGLLHALRVVVDFAAMFYVSASGYTVYSPVTYYLAAQVLQLPLTHLLAVLFFRRTSHARLTAYYFALSLLGLLAIGVLKRFAALNPATINDTDLYTDTLIYVPEGYLGIAAVAGKSLAQDFAASYDAYARIDSSFTWAFYSNMASNLGRALAYRPLFLLLLSVVCRVSANILYKRALLQQMQVYKHMRLLQEKARLKQGRPSPYYIDKEGLLR